MGVRRVVHSAVGSQSIPRVAWDALASERDVYLKCRWLDVVDRTVQVPVEYFWVEAQGRIVAGLVGVPVTADVPWALGRLHTVLSNSVAEDEEGAAEFVRSVPGGDAGHLMPSMTIGGRHVGSNRMLLGDGAELSDVHLLLTAVELRAREKQMRSVSLLYLDETETEVAAVLGERGYAMFGVGRSSHLRVPAGGFDGYLASLSRNRRQSIYAERRKIAKAGVTTTIVPLGDAPLSELVELELALLSKYGISNTAANLLPIMEQTRDVFGEDALVALALTDGVVRGFATVLAQGNTWTARQVGFDYSFQNRTHLALYFELLFYTLVEQGGQLGIREIQYGLGSVEAKSSRGCVSTAQRGYVLRLEDVAG
jgi:hypothetical protein